VKQFSGSAFVIFSETPEAQHARKLKALEDENRRLKKLLAETMLDASTLKEMLGKNF
jgi:putative transposase